MCVLNFSSRKGRKEGFTYRCDYIGYIKDAKARLLATVCKLLQLGKHEFLLHKGFASNLR